MPRRIISREADDTIVPEGNLPASKPEAGSSDRSDGSIFNAQTRKYETSDTGDSSKRSIPQSVQKASSTSTGEVETVDGVNVEDVSQGAQLPDDNEEGVHTQLGGSEPVEGSAGGSETWRTNADLKSERRRTAEYHAKVQRAEAKSALETAKLRVQAKGLLAQEKELDQRIRRAKETSKPRAVVSPVGGVYASGKKTSAVETEISKPSSWLRAVQREENVSPSFVWHINKEKIYENYGKQFIKKFDSAENEVHVPIPQGSVGKVSGTEAVSGPPTGDFMRIMSEQVLVLPSGKVVTPIRQFCETKVLPTGTREAFFYDFGPVSFSNITEDGSTTVTESSSVIRSSGTATTPRGTRITIGYTQTEESPIDIVASANRSFALESINDESAEVLTRAFNDDSGSSGDATNRKAKGGGAKTGRWVDGNLGTQITADASGNGKLSYKGLLSAKGVIQDEGLDDSNLITYTSGKGIRDLTLDSDLDNYIGFSRPAIITEATVERIAGTNLVRTSALTETGEGTGTARSVMFIPNVAFGLVSGRDLTMEAQRRNELQSIFLTGTQKIAGVVKNVEATVRISHL
jgi:hypothetical protein|tara:strand:+ start:1431 stop:3158 length:1728 start_codon:yes stop_codon:yes gene_type:complete